MPTEKAGLESYQEYEDMVAQKELTYNRKVRLDLEEDSKASETYM